MQKFRCFYRLFISSITALTFWSCTTTSPKSTPASKAKETTQSSVLEVKGSLSRKIVDQVITKKMAPICACMDEYTLATNQTPMESRIHFKIKKSGHTADIGIQNKGDERLRSCLADNVRVWEFPENGNKPEKSETAVQYLFKPIEHCKNIKRPKQKPEPEADEGVIENVSDDKPVIYLYPPHDMDVDIALEYDGILTTTYPAYDETIKGWKVHAKPDGTLHDLRSGREYSYIFWEGLDKSQPREVSTGFVVPGDETEEFLVRELREIGLMPREYNEFIVYWLPKLKDNPYNLIHFEGESYAERARLTITPTPDKILRVMMLVRPLQHRISIQPQTFPKFIRTGFTVVEWGGSLLQHD